MEQLVKTYPPTRPCPLGHTHFDMSCIYVLGWFSVFHSGSPYMCASPSLSRSVSVVTDGSHRQKCRRSSGGHVFSPVARLAPSCCATCMCVCACVRSYAHVALEILEDIKCFEVLFSYCQILYAWKQSS